LLLLFQVFRLLLLKLAAGFIQRLPVFFGMQSGGGEFFIQLFEVALITRFQFFLMLDALFDARNFRSKPVKFRLENSPEAS